jgi:hypothetical protein
MIKVVPLGQVDAGTACCLGFMAWEAFPDFANCRLMEDLGCIGHVNAGSNTVIALPKKRQIIQHLNCAYGGV